MVKRLAYIVGCQLALFAMVAQAAAEWKELDVLQAIDDPLAIVDTQSCRFRLRLDYGAKAKQQKFFSQLGMEREEKEEPVGEGQSLDFYLNLSDVPQLIRAGVLDDESGQALQQSFRQSIQVVDLRIKVVLGPSPFSHRVNIAYTTVSDKGVRKHYKPLRTAQLRLESSCS